MSYVIDIIIVAIISVIGLLTYYYSKRYAMKMICEHPELSNEKVKAITKMMTKQHNKILK